MSEPISVSDAALLLGISRTRVHQLCRAGILRFTKLGRDLAIDSASLAGARHRRQQRGRPRKETGKTAETCSE